MDRRERTGDINTAIIAATEENQSNIWTSLPALVVAWDEEKNAIIAQPTIQASVKNKDGSSQWISLPIIYDCLVVFAGGGGHSVTFTPQENDECVLVFASRCIDAWWQSGGIQQQAEFRMHSLSDGFAFVGLHSRPRSIRGILPGITLTKDDGSSFVNLYNNEVIIRAANVVIEGNLTVNGNISLPIVDTDITSHGIAYADHVHGGVESGGSVTGVAE